MDYAFTFYKTKNIASESTYPYTARDGTCKTSFTIAILSGSVTGNMDVSGASGLMSALNQQPLSVALCVCVWCVVVLACFCSRILFFAFFFFLFCLFFFCLLFCACSSLTQEIEDNTARSGEDAMKLSEMKEDLEDTQEPPAEDKQFLAELEKSCATKGDEWDERCKTRTEELLALADTINILNDDEDPQAKELLEFAKNRLNKFYRIHGHLV